MTAKNLRRVAEGGTYCHVYNRGIENRNVFVDDADYQVFLDYLEEYLSAPKAPESTKKDFTINGRVFKGVPHQPKNYFNKIELIAYSLKPDHFHLLLHQKTPKSLQAFIRSLATRYSMYFNKKYNRTGSLFDGPYKSVIVNGETSLSLLTRYLHKDGGYSTYPEYSGAKQTPWVITKVVPPIKKGKGNYKDYIEKFEPNQAELGLLNAITIENVKEHLERRDLAKPNLKPWSRIPELLAASAVFVLLLGVGVRNIATASNSPQNSSAILGIKITSASPDVLTKSANNIEERIGELSSWAGKIKNPRFIQDILGPVFEKVAKDRANLEVKLAPTPTAKPPKIMLTKKRDATVLNIRQQPTVESEKIGQAVGGDTFEFVSENSGWYQVKLPDGQSGFIFSEFIEKQEEASND